MRHDYIVSDILASGWQYVFNDPKLENKIPFIKSVPRKYVFKLTNM